jgi:hypothetical protein
MTTTQNYIRLTTFNVNKSIYKSKFTELRSLLSEPQGEYGWTEVEEHATSSLCTYFIYFLRRRQIIADNSGLCIIIQSLPIRTPCTFQTCCTNWEETWPRFANRQVGRRYATTIMKGEFGWIRKRSWPTEDTGTWTAWLRKTTIIFRTVGRG